MKAESCHCPVCGYGHGPVELVCWDCRGKGTKVAPRKELGQARRRGLRCEGCGRAFGGERVFDAHRAGDFERAGKQNTRRCLTEAEMRAKGMTLADGVWHVGYRHPENVA